MAHSEFVTLEARPILLYHDHSLSKRVKLTHSHRVRISGQTENKNVVKPDADTYMMNVDYFGLLGEMLMEERQHFLHCRSHVARNRWLRQITARQPAVLHVWEFLNNTLWPKSETLLQRLMYSTSWLGVLRVISRL